MMQDCTWTSAACVLLLSSGAPANIFATFPFTYTHAPARQPTQTFSSALMREGERWQVKFTLLHRSENRGHACLLPSNDSTLTRNGPTESMSHVYMTCSAPGPETPSRIIEAAQTGAGSCRREKSYKRETSRSGYHTPSLVTDA